MATTTFIIHVGHFSNSASFAYRSFAIVSATGGFRCSLPSTRYFLQRTVLPYKPISLVYTNIDTIIPLSA